jgi:hypothetical protein
MKNMPTITSSPRYPEATQVASGPCLQSLLADGRRFGNLVPLAERCAR